MDIGGRIKKYRKKAGLTQEQLAKKTTISLSAIGKYEIGERTPKYETLEEIAKALEATLDELLGLNAKQINLSHIPTIQLIEELNSRDDFPIEIQWKVGE